MQGSRIVFVWTTASVSVLKILIDFFWADILSPARPTIEPSAEIGYQARPLISRSLDVALFAQKLQIGIDAEAEGTLMQSRQSKGTKEIFIHRVSSFPGHPDRKRPSKLCRVFAHETLDGGRQQQFTRHSPELGIVRAIPSS